MNTYEKWSLVVSILAIIISITVPLIQYMCKRIKRLHLDLIPFANNGITIFFNESGSYFRASFCIRCQNQDTTISNINATITRSDTCSKVFEWSYFDSIYVNWLGTNTNNRINSVSCARPYKIKADTLEPFIIEFSNDENKNSNRICTKRDSMLSRFIQFSTPIENINQLHQTFKASQNYTELINDYNQLFFWDAGQYCLQFDITHDVNKISSSMFHFNISNEESQKLKENSEQTVFCSVHNSYNIPCNFYTLTKELIKDC